MRDYAGGRDDWIAGGLQVDVEGLTDPDEPGQSLVHGGDTGLHGHVGPAGSGDTA